MIHTAKDKLLIHIGLDNGLYVETVCLISRKDK